MLPIPPSRTTAAGALYTSQLLGEDLRVPDSDRLLPTRDRERDFISQWGPVMVAIDFFERAEAEARRAEEIRLLFPVMAAEALVGDGDDERNSSKRKDRIANRLCVFREHAQV